MENLTRKFRFHIGIAFGLLLTFALLLVPAPLVAQEDGQVMGTLAQKGKPSKEFSSPVTVKKDSKVKKSAKRVGVVMMGSAPTQGDAEETLQQKLVKYEAIRNFIGQMHGIDYIIEANIADEFFNKLGQITKDGRKIQYLVIFGHGTRGMPHITLHGGEELNPIHFDRPRMVKQLNKQIAEVNKNREKICRLKLNKDKTAADVDEMELLSNRNETYIQEIPAEIKDFNNLEKIKNTMAPNADILLLNCSAASTPQNIDFVMDIGRAFLSEGGGNIYASKRDIDFNQAKNIYTFVQAFVKTGKLLAMGEYYISGTGVDYENWRTFPIEAATLDQPNLFVDVEPQCSEATTESPAGLIKAKCEPFEDSGRLEYFWERAPRGSLKASYSPDLRQASEGIKTVRVKVRDTQNREGEAAAYVLVTKSEDLEAVIELSDARPPVNQQISAGLAIRKGQLSKDTNIQWRTTGGLVLQKDSGQSVSLVARSDGQMIAALVQKGKVIKEVSTPVTVTKDDLEAIIELSDLNPPVNQKISANLVFKKGQLPLGAAIQWRSTGGLSLDKGSGQNASLIARGDGQVVAVLVKDGKTLKEFVTAVTVKRPDEDKKETTSAKGSEGEDKPGEFFIKIKAPAEVGYTEIFKVAAVVPAGFAQCKIEYTWDLDHANLLNKPNGPEAVIQPNYEQIIGNKLSELEIRVTAFLWQQEGFRGRAEPPVRYEGKIRIKLRPEGFSARARKSWTGKADHYGVNLSYGKQGNPSSFLGDFCQLTVELGKANNIVPSDDVPAVLIQSGGFQSAKRIKIKLGDFAGYLEEKPPRDRIAGEGTVRGAFSKGNITFTVDGRIYYNLGAANQSKALGGGWERVEALYQEMLDIVKSVSLGTGGGMIWDLAKDSKTAGDKAKDQPKETPKPLSVALKAAKTKLMPGEKVEVPTSVTGGLPAYKYSWSSNIAGKEAKGEFTAPRKPGSYTVSLNVTDRDGHKASANHSFTVEGVQVKMIRLGPAEVCVGGSSRFRATVVNLEGKPVSGNYLLRWEPHPEVTFDKCETTGAAAEVDATFNRPDPARVWVNVLEQEGGAYHTVAESEQLAVTVKKPGLNLAFTPLNPRVGQETTATVQIQQPCQDKAGVLDFRWLPVPQNAQQLSESQDKRSIKFIPKDTKPITVTVIGRTPHFGDDLGQAQGTIQAQGYQVTVTVAGPMGPEPQKWDPVKGGLVADPKAIVIHQNVRVKAEVAPAPAKGPAKYRWSVNDDSHIQSGQAGSEIMVNRSQVGTCQVTVVVEDAAGSKLGTANASFQVSVDQGAASKEMRAAAQKLAAEGKLDEAISLAEQAAKLDQGTANINFLKKLKVDKETIANQLEKTKSLIAQGKFAEADKELAAAKSLNAKYPPVVEAEKQLAAAKAGLQKHGETKLAQAKTLAGQGRLDEAIGLAGAAAKLDPQNPEAPKLAATWKGLKDKVVKLKGEGQSLESQKLVEAIAKYQEALKLLTDTSLAQHVAELQGKLAKVKQNRDLTDKLRKEGEALEGQKKLAESIGKYQESLTYLPDEKLKEHVKALEVGLAEDKRKLEIAKSLRNEGATFQQQGKLAEAITKYKESLKYYPDASMESHIRTLQAKLVQAKPKQLTQDKERQEKEKQVATNLETAKSLRNEGAAFQQQGKLAEAIVKYKESLTYYPDASMETHIHALQAKLDQEHKTQASAAQARDKQEKARRLQAEGAVLEKQGNLAEALGKYQASLKYYPDTKLEAQIPKLQAKVQQAAKLKEAIRLRTEAMTLLNNGNIPAMLAKAKESLKYYPDAELEAVIRPVEADLAKREAAKKEAAKVRETKDSSLNNFFGNYSGTYTIRQESEQFSGSLTLSIHNGSVTGTATYQGSEDKVVKASIKGQVDPRTGAIRGQGIGTDRIKILNTFMDFKLSMYWEGTIRGNGVAGNIKAISSSTDTGTGKTKTERVPWTGTWQAQKR
jgi:tetratricopeptide (TPR) repeat protein